MASDDANAPTACLPDEPTHRPLERFWPYAELSEQPSDEELAQAPSGDCGGRCSARRALPFSISLVFPAFDGRALRARRGAGAGRRTSTSRCRPGGVLAASRAVLSGAIGPIGCAISYELVGDVPESEVLVDDRPVPYARELWLPLVWCLIR